MTMGQRIKAARERSGKTLDEIAKLCNTTKQTIFKYENNIVTNIPYDRIVQISNALSVSPAYLFGWDEQTPTVTQETMSDDERMLIELYRQIPAEKQAAAIEFLRVALKMH